MKRKVTASRILRNPAFIFLSIGLGIYTGIKFPDFTKNIRSVGELYLRFLKFLILPILATALISGVANLIQLSRIKGLLKKVVVGFLITVIFSAGIGTAVGIVGSPGTNLTEKQSSAIAEFIDIEREFDSDASAMGIITDTSSNVLLSVILFSILLGVSIGLINKSHRDVLVTISEALLLAFQKIVSWMMLLLPFAIISIVSNIASSTSFEVILVMVRFITIFAVVGLIVLIFGTLIICVKSGQELGDVFTLLEPIFISLSTGSSVAAIPSAITTMSRKLKFDKESIKLAIPFGQNFGQYGNIIYFAVATVFISQLYSYHLNVSAIFFVIVGAIFAGVASVGTSGITTLSFLVISLTFLKLPVEGAVLLFVTIETIIQPLRSFLTVFINLVTTSLVVQPDTYFDNDETPGVLLQNIPEDIDLRAYFQNYNGEVPIIELSKSEFLATVFPKAHFKLYKNWKLVEPLWSSLDFNIVVGDKEYVQELSHQESDEIKFALLNRK